MNETSCLTNLIWPRIIGHSLRIVCCIALCCCVTGNALAVPLTDINGNVINKGDLIRVSDAPGGAQIELLFDISEVSTLLQPYSNIDLLTDATPISSFGDTSESVYEYTSDTPAYEHFSAGSIEKGDLVVVRGPNHPENVLPVGISTLYDYDWVSTDLLLSSGIDLSADATPVSSWGDNPHVGIYEYTSDSPGYDTSSGGMIEKGDLFQVTGHYYFDASMLSEPRATLIVDFSEVSTQLQPYIDLSADATLISSFGDTSASVYEYTSDTPSYDTVTGSNLDKGDIFRVWTYHPDYGHGPAQLERLLDVSAISSLPIDFLLDVRPISSYGASYSAVYEVTREIDVTAVLEPTTFALLGLGLLGLGFNRHKRI